ncbi:pyridoxal-phosphate dependent enzyme, partial [Acinetobacter soli]|uniref:pyridoxal-phosphate dependent enzyme n=1 Tax=Acinetobacter soli TaxID=487316 RepID=UPI00281307B6
LLARIYDLVKVTPLHYLDNLSDRLGVNVHLKREDFQKIHSFKLRGAYNKIKNLSESQLKSGIITASAGNHAQGV